jgi:hypothetical protein
MRGGRRVLPDPPLASRPATDKKSEDPMTNPKHRYKKTPGYNVQMIRDFLKHLEWELRLRYFEYTQPAGTVSEELVDLLAEYQKKRNCIGLLATNKIDTEGMTNEEEAEAGLERWRAVMAQRTQESLEAM